MAWGKKLRVLVWALCSEEVTAPNAILTPAPRRAIPIPGGHLTAGWNVNTPRGAPVPGGQPKLSPALRDQAPGICVPQQGPTQGQCSPERAPRMPGTRIRDCETAPTQVGMGHGRCTWMPGRSPGGPGTGGRGPQ